MLGFVLAVAGGVVLLFFLAGFRVVANDRIGIVEKRFGAGGSVKRGLLALRGEAGFQPEVLRGGVHWRMPLQYAVHRYPLVTIPQGKVGYVFARDGLPLAPDQTLGSNAEANDFQDARSFLLKGGQRGPQRALLREGTYAVNLVQFAVLTPERVHHLELHRSDDELFRKMADLIAERRGFEPVVIKGADDLVGVVTVHDGPSLATGEIIAPVTAPAHNNFQNADAFVAVGGLRGRQLQVLVDGTYFVNRLFATVEYIPKTVIDVGYVGVVVSYTGQEGADLSGSDYKHGELVARGTRGVWSAPLLPGKYAFNTYAGKVVVVPTTNFILKWNKREVGSHRFDENLAEVSLITKDAFEPSLPLSVVVHIDYRKAPLVVQRFGDIKRLVEQTLDPMVAAYFKNIGQTRTLIQLLQERAEIQQHASSEMKEKFAHYNLELEEVLIGTPSSVHDDDHIEEILTQIRLRQIAEERMHTYTQQERAAVRERELREAEARAEQQKKITESELGIAIQANQGKADYQRSVQEAARIRALAEARGDEIRRLAEAEADRAARVGIGQAIATEEQVAAYGGPKLQLVQTVMGRIADAIERSGVEIVPRVVVGSNGASDSRSPNALEALLALLLSEHTSLEGASVAKRSDPERDELRTNLRKQLASAVSAPTTTRLPSAG